MGIEINDDNADESFTVYDHPKVIIFKKRADFCMDKVRAMFDGYELDRIVRVMPKQVTKAPNNLMLADEDLALRSAQGGTWSSMFDRDSLANRWPTLIWLLALYAAWAWRPFRSALSPFARLRDRGYVLCKTLGLLLLGYLSWLLPSLQLCAYSRAALICAAAGLCWRSSAAVAWRQRRAMLAFVRARWRLLLANELLFLAFFFVFWLIRRGNPDLWHPVMGGEKPMDLAYLNAIIKSTYFPPYDPWFAGGYLNYYYFGWVIVGHADQAHRHRAHHRLQPGHPHLVRHGGHGRLLRASSTWCPADDDEGGWLPRALRFGAGGRAAGGRGGQPGRAAAAAQGLQELGERAEFASKHPRLGASWCKAVVGPVAAAGQGAQSCPSAASGGIGTPAAS